MGREQREDLERRVLALVRNQLDYLDEDYPDGYECGDLVITCRFYYAPEPGSRLMPWHGGPFPGWYVNAWTRGTSPSWVVDEDLLQEALAYVQRQRDSDPDDDEDDEDDDDDD